MQGRWSITEMDVGEAGVFDPEAQAEITFDGDERSGRMRFGPVEGDLDCRTGRLGGQPLVEFSWLGSGGNQQLAGRGWAVRTSPATLHGQVFVHGGGDARFTAVRVSAEGGAAADRTTVPLDPRGEAAFEALSIEERLERRTHELGISRIMLNRLIESGIAMSAERDKQALVRKILNVGREICNADAGTLYLCTDHDTLRFAVRTLGDDLPSFEIPLRAPDGAPVMNYVSTYVALTGQAVTIDDVYAESRFDLSGTRRFDAETGYRTVSMLTVPMAPSDGKVIGVLQFLNALDPSTGRPVPFDPEVRGYVEALASQAGVALENQTLIETLEALVDAVIRTLAMAIDAKSPYTGGHCARVPKLATLLAEKAAASDRPPFDGFTMTTEEFKEFEIAAWLHDCGKVTTPEHVVDKATKLETIYNRIHEVRTRFEVLWRDAELAFWRRRDEPDADQATLARLLDEDRARLRDDFDFLAQCNVGGESISAEDVARIRRIATTTWTRHFDDTIGLSHAEQKRLALRPHKAPPAEEPLLADRPEHIVPRERDPLGGNPRGFTMTAPEHQYNFGEIYNLCVSRGTLTAEERFIINDHIVQTINMLEQLPFPDHLRRVPEYAGAHHETLVGTGYPRGLTKDQMSLPARIMVIADVFEALTASDRPYKKPKTLSEALRIMSFMRDDRHIDPDLFDLFVRTGVYAHYADLFLLPEQIDAVDVTRLLSRP